MSAASMSAAVLSYSCLVVAPNCSGVLGANSIARAAYFCSISGVAITAPISR